jgi:hypothetical protein
MATYKEASGIYSRFVFTIVRGLGHGVPGRDLTPSHSLGNHSRYLHHVGYIRVVPTLHFQSGDIRYATLRSLGVVDFPGYPQLRLQHSRFTMAKQEITGKTADEIAAKRKSFEGSEEEWQQKYCLSKIPRQPEDYDGPPRFCQNTDTHKVGSNYRCKFHGGAQEDDFEEQTKNLTPLGNMKHGMKATREHLIEDFDEKDQALYDWITESFPEAYDIDLEEDPASVYDLHRLAAEIVRAERGRGYLIEEGEVNEEPVRNDEGRVVVDDSGEVVTEKSSHYLAQMLKDQDNKITRLEKELGITRKEQLKQDTSDEAVEALTKGFTELGRAFLQRDEQDYDPEEEPWSQDAEDD